MLTYRQNLNLPIQCFENYGASPGEVLYFDIETTGLSADSSFLYLICVGFLSKGKPVLCQWFSESFTDEVNLLHAFFSFMEEYKILVHYNGTTFDIPYLEKKCHQYKLDYRFNLASVDLYRMVKPHKALLSLSGCRQKDIERFLGIERKDQYDGGQLIEIYKQYLGRAQFDRMKHGTPLSVSRNSGLATMPSSPSETLLYLLLLHNAEDVEGLIRISCLLPLLQVLNGCVASYEDFRFTDTELTSTLSYPNCPCILPGSYAYPYGTLEISENKLTVHIPYYTGELKYFFDNYKDYYYLPYEDYAVHKSVAEGVDKSHRKAATAATCYVKKSGTFLPQREELFAPALRREKKSPVSWFEHSLLQTQSRDEEGLARITEYINSLFC